MNATVKSSRRNFLKSSAATTAGLVIGYHVPFLNKQAVAQGLTATIAPEVNAWVVCKPTTKSSFVLPVPRWVRARSRVSRKWFPKSWNAIGPT